MAAVGSDGGNADDGGQALLSSLVAILREANYVHVGMPWWW
jgi:hypothetical protein